MLAAPDAPPCDVRVRVPGGVWFGQEDGAREPLRDLAIRAVGGEDEAFLLESEEAPPSVQATGLLARCVEDGDRIAPALTIGDREALLLHLRRITFGEAMEIVLRCPDAACNEPLQSTLAVGDLLVAPYAEVRPSYQLSCVVDGARFEVWFRLPTSADLDRVAPRAWHDAAAAASELFRACVLRATKDREALEAGRIPESVRVRVAAMMAERDPQAELELELRCPACGVSFSTIFDTTTFLLQELGERGARLLAEIHTLALHYHWSEAEILRMPARRRARYLEHLAGAAGRARTR